jgi:hypothetical protein
MARGWKKNKRGSRTDRHSRDSGIDSMKRKLLFQGKEWVKW